MARQRKFGMQSALALAIALIPAASFGQGGAQIPTFPQTTNNGAFHYHRFFALTPRGQVYVLQFDSQTLQLIQSNQPVWTLAGVTAIAPAQSVRAVSGDTGGSFFAITADHNIYYVDASVPGSARAKLISTDAPADKTAIGYFGCHGTLYTIPANGLLTARTLQIWGADHLPTQFSAPIQSGTGWQNVSSAQCVESYGAFNQIYATDTNGVVNWYRHSSPGMTGWTQGKTNLSYISSPAIRGGVHIFGFQFVLEARYASGPGGVKGGVTQGVRTARDFDGMDWPKGKAFTGVVSGGANLLDFSAVVDDGYSESTIG